MLTDVDQRHALQKRFDNTHPHFQDTIKHIAEHSPKLHPLVVFALWNDYSDKCAVFDQSPVMSEFLQWYAKELGIETTTINKLLDYAERTSDA